ncbi:MAG TPA: amino acid adenylation domain-containing protein, partial [Ktedonobacteraceae bacterium]
MDSTAAFHNDHLKNEYPILPAKSASGTRDADIFPPVHPFFPDLFEAQAARVPDALALLFDQEQITYQELNTRANRLAHFLQAQGIGAETRVGISMERSPAMIIALLAILKAGGAYVPLDPSYPQERLHFMLQDAHISLLLTQEAFEPLLSAPTVRVIMMDRDAALWQNAKTCNPLRFLLRENLAYLIYTSGSTGRPKGTLLTHHGLSNLIAGLLQNLQITMQDRILHIGSLSFDVSVAEITLALSAGAVLCLQKQEDILPGRIFLDLLRRQAISIAFMVPSFLRRLPPADLPDWRALISGGEACTPDLVACWANGRQFFNAYAPTEATVCATMILCQPGDTTIALGNPLPNLQLYLLDESLQPVQPGKTGELYLGGAGLARGYYNLPAITAERFIPDPFAQQPGQRLYKTGDLIRLMADGRITFLGREDTQIKLRGFRVELGEIEHVLRGCNHVQDVVVLCREDASEDHRLVAYVVPQAGCAEQLSPSRLDQHARAHLPGYMLPAHYILLPAFPLTPGAKVDRQALPAPDSVRPELTTPFVRPSTPIEQKLEDMCTEILRVERLGVNDNFFELGGNSLLIAQVTARIESALGIRIPPAAFFAEPSISGLAQYIEQHASSDFIVSTALEIPVLTRDGQLFPVSFSQERVWFLQELEPDNKAYHAQAVFRFNGKLNINALERSLQAIFHRHEIFRTTFPVVEGVPHQQIHPTYTLHLPVIDLEALSEFEREQHVQSIIQQELEKPFDVAVLPLARWTLIRLEPQRHLLLHIEHHFVHDGWSFTVFLRDLQAFYQAFATDAPLQLPPLPIQFVDFVVWQRRWMQGVEGERQLRYWQNVLSDAPAMLELPTDYPRPALQSFRGASMRIVLPNELQRNIRELCRREGTTLYMTLFSAFVTLLVRYTGQTDICVGAGVANRRLAVTEPIIGMIINTVVLRTRVEDDPTFRTLLKRVRQITLEAYEHQDLPFGRVVESLCPQRSLSHSPLYQAAFSFHDAPSPDLRLPGLSVELEEAISNGSAKFDLNIVVIPRAEQQRHFSYQEERDELIFVWEYNTDLFKEETIRLMVSVYQTLLESVCAHPEQHISALSLLTPEQRQQQLVDWNSLHTHSTAHQCIHRAFEAQVECTPHAPVLLFANMTLTYAQLNQAANQLARYLRGCGVQPGDLVGLYMERSLDLIVAMVGILKAGAAYVPIDLAYPLERMAFIIQDTHMGVLLTQETLHAQLPGLNIQVISLDQARTRIGQEAWENMVCEVQAEDLACVIYTSGSTGIPKGVAIPHRGVMRLVLQTNYIQFEPADRVAQASNTSFDAATYEIWGALLNGATLVGVPREVTLAPRAFAAFLESQHISVLLLTTALFHQIAQEVPDAFRTLRHLSFGGEAVNPNRVKIILTAGRPEYLLHLYGPAENTTISTWYAVEDVPEAALTVPIGAPIANSQAFILDHQMQLVPPGCPGELYLGGDGLARGYWNRPDLTAEHFVPHPFSSRLGARLYRTGDLVRARADGQLEFLGRVDFQVKVRGFRIEPGEIEVILSQHPDIHEAIVLLREDAPEEKRLVAYLVPKPERMPDLRQLRQYLQARLPDYMLPAALVILERLPLNPNGKLDRRALPPPEYSNPDLGAQYAPPRNHAEELLTAIWAEVLGREHVGIYDNFFESGGHSLLATRVISRIQQVFQVTLPLRSLFEHPYVAELATAVTQIHSRPDDLALTKRSRVADREKVLPLSFAQQRLWFLDKLVPGNPFYNICRAISLSGDLQIAALAQSLHELVRRHESLRTHFSLLAEHPVQVISPLLPLPLPLVDLSALLPSQREAVLHSLAAQQAACPFVLSQAPLLRVCLLLLEPREHVLLLCLHHLICDGWSLDIFFRELSSLYASSSTRRPCSLPALPIQYADYTLWQRERFAGSLLHEQLSYWRKQLADLPPLALPTDHPRPLVQRFRGAYQRIQFPASLTRQLKDLSQHEQVTLFMTLLAGFQILLARCCRQEDIAVGTPIANRTRPEMEGLIGFFVNTLVLRTD